METHRVINLLVELVFSVLNFIYFFGRAPYTAGQLAIRGLATTVQGAARTRTVFFVWLAAYSMDRIRGLVLRPRRAGDPKIKVCRF
jgi:hypothetical protein